MRIVGRDKLNEFCAAHADVRKWIEIWIFDVEAARWQSSQDVKNLYASASFLASNIVIFNVKGNHYRLEAKITYNTGIVVVQWIGTHAEYSKRY